MQRRNILSSALPWACGLLTGATLAQTEPVVPHAAFDGLDRRIRSDFPDVQSVVVVRDGRLLFEHYAPGSGVETFRDVQSVTKSILSLAVGAALGRGALGSVDRRVADVVRIDEQAESAASTALTLRHLLTMTAGFAPAERFDMGTADDPAFLMRRARAHAPGATFAYDNLAANLLSVALEAAVGATASAFAGRELFAPLGITAFEWEKGSHGHSFGFSGLKLRTRDMAALGQLALHAGDWQGTPLVPGPYMQAAVSAQNAGGRPVGLPYGYLCGWFPRPHRRAPSSRAASAASSSGSIFRCGS